MPRANRTKVLFLAVLATVVLSNLPVVRYLLYPLLLFATWVHEMCHGLMAIALGGRFQTLVINPDTSGLATYLADFGSIRRGLVASAGYLGTTLFGAGLVAAQASRRTARIALFGIGATLLLSVLLWVRNPFGIVTCLLLGVGFLLLARKVDERWHPFLLTYLGAQTCLNGLMSIRVLYGVTSHGHSDANTMADLFWLPHWVWATLWLALSVGALVMALRIEDRRERSRADWPSLEI
ncbi:MAG: M50 family metallopeptidase [Acidobacteriota bacterium]